MLKKEEAKEDKDSKSKKTTTKTKKLSSKAEKIVKKFISTKKISQADKETLFKEFDIDTNKSSKKKTVKISATSINSSNLDKLIDSKNLSKLLKELGVESETTKKTVTKSITGTYNPWADDSLTSEEKIKKKKYKINEREYKVKSDEKGRESYYPGMTFYTDKNYKLKKLYIPIFKFKNCSKVKVFIYKRQDKNNKKNTVELGKLMHSPKTFSLKKAKEKGKYQYMEEGFTLDFGSSGLSLPKAQYVIVILPIPKSGDGSVFVKTYKPKNSKDFCIKYKGDSKAAHFELVDRYQEIWYNPSKMVVEEENYYKKGHVISKTVTFEGKSLERISSVKPVVKKHLTSEDTKADSYQLYVNTGGSWIKVEPGRYNKIKNGGAKTFKWKLVFKSDGKKSPKLAYSKKDKYAIKFLLKREKKANWMNAEQVVDINKTMCITSKQISGNDVLKEYVGDSNFATKQSRFQGHEFARIWADNENNDNLLIDIQGSDLDMSYEFDKTVNGEEKHFKGKDIPTWTYHYCDLTLDDF